MTTPSATAAVADQASPNTSLIASLMPVSPLAVATRAFVHVLLALARTYNLSLVVNRASSPVVTLQQLSKMKREV